MNILLEGEANDYVGKGMNGGRIVINPHPDFRKRGDVSFTDQVRFGLNGLWGCMCINKCSVYTLFVILHSSAFQPQKTHARTPQPTKQPTR